MNRQRGTLIAFVLLALFLAGCNLLPAPPSTPSSSNLLTYDAPVSLTIKKGAVVPGTSVGYTGKSQTGAAAMALAGMLAVKQVGDSVDWQGTPVPNASVKLNTRLVSFDDQGATLVGTAHIELANSIVQPGSSPGATLIQFNAPVTYSLKKGESVPGAGLLFVGSGTEGAQFAGIDGYPYRKTLDSLQYVGRLNPKVYLKLELRMLNYSDSSALLGGVATVTIEQ